MLPGMDFPQTNSRLKRFFEFSQCQMMFCGLIKDELTFKKQDT